MSLIDTIQSYAEQPLNKQLLLNILKEYKRPYDKIGELVKQHILVQIKKGLYIPGKNLKAQGPERFLIANHLHGPSYVSSDSALSHWVLFLKEYTRSVLLQLCFQGNIKFLLEGSAIHIWSCLIIVLALCR